MRITFLLPVPNQPRYKKRIDGLKACGAEATVYAFEREYLPHGGARLGYRSLGFLESGRYWRRIPALAKAAWITHRDLRQSDAIYCFGTDLAAIGIVARLLARRRVPVTLERGDIGPSLLGASFRSRLLRWFERGVLKRCHLVVVTSPDYITHYFAAVQRQPKDKFFVVENKIDVELPLPVPLPAWDGTRPLRIGYFGLLRDAVSWRILEAAVAQFPDRFELVVYGRPAGIPDFEESVRRHPGITYGGEYEWPDDLPKLYDAVDLVWACFPKTPEVRRHNLWQWPMTNRFYEACAYRKPMVAQVNSADGRRTVALGIGLVVDTDDPQATIQALLDVTPDNLEGWRQAMLAVPDSVFRYGDEHCQLLRSLGDRENDAEGKEAGQLP